MMSQEFSASAVTLRYDGLLRCSRYAFGPNRLHYCGPDQNRELASHMTALAADEGLATLLTKFETLYPYLELIAHGNNIADPFDVRVVSAYWLGNHLLDRASGREYYEHLTDRLGMKRRIRPKNTDIITEKLRAGAHPHHAFHVLNIWRMHSIDDEKSLSEIGECVVSVGTVKSVSGPSIDVETEAVVRLPSGMFAYDVPKERRLTRSLGSEGLDDLLAGELITFHWGVPCERITEEEARALKKYTQESIDLANRFL